MMKIHWTAACFTVLLAAPGCHTTRDALDDLSIAVQNRVGAWAAWQKSPWRRRNLPYAKDFEDGFISGYIAVASGAGDAPPALPPRKYWDPSYLGHQGRQRTLAWYHGYAEGARAAQRQGVGDWSRLPGIALAPGPGTGRAARPAVAVPADPAASSAGGVPRTRSGVESHAIRPPETPENRSQQAPMPQDGFYPLPSIEGRGA